MPFPAFWGHSQWKYRAQNYRRLMETSMLKRLVKQRNGRVSKTKRLLSQNRRPEIFAKIGRFLAKTGWLESLHHIDKLIVSRRQDTQDTLCKQSTGVLWRFSRVQSYVKWVLPYSSFENKKFHKCFYFEQDTMVVNVSVNSSNGTAIK